MTLGLTELAGSVAAWPYAGPVATLIRQNPIAATIDRTVPLLRNQSVSITFRFDVALLYARLKRSRISGTICHQLESLELSPWKRSIRAFQLQFMASSSWRHTTIVKSLRLPYLATCSWIRTSSAAMSMSERARNVRGGCSRDLGARSMLSRQAIHIRRVRRLLGQAPGHLHQHHYQDAGAAADQGCCDHPPCRDIHLRRFFAVAVAGSKLGCAARFSLCPGKLIVCLLTDIVMCATAPRFLSLCSIQSRCPA
jgi:hypothetical protein